MASVNNPKLFREMSEPHESREAMDKESDAFFEGLLALREKHRVKNIVITCEFIHFSDGEEVSGYAIQSVGDRNAAPALAAYTAGKLKAEAEEFFNKLLRGK